MARNRYDVLAAICAGLGGVIVISGDQALQFMLSAVRPQPNWLVLIAVIGPALSSWLFFPALARKPGLAGIERDLLIMLAAILVAILICGTLVVPGPGTILALFATLAILAENPARVLVFVIGTLIAMTLARRKRLHSV